MRVVSLRAVTLAKRLATISGAGVLLIGFVCAAAGAQPAQHGALTGLRVVTTTTHGNRVLSPRHVNVVVANSKLAFVVSLHNTGARRRVIFRLSVSRPRSSLGPLVVSKSAWLRADRRATVRVGTFGPVVFAIPGRLKVSISDPQSLETWTATYPVIFSLG